MKSDTSVAGKSNVTKDYVEVHFYDEVYRTYVVFMMSSRQELKDFCADNKLKDLDLAFDTSAGFTIVFDSETCDVEGQNFYLVWTENRFIPLLVHEVSHLTMMIFDQKDIPLRIENQEAFAYYIEHWVKRIMEVWEPPKQKRVNIKASKKLEEKKENE